MRQPLVQASDQVIDCHDGMREKHFRTHRAHDASDSFALLGAIAMDRAFGAGGFVVTERTTSQSFLCVMQQRFAILAKAVLRLVMLLAVASDHRFDHLGFFFEYA